jgi:hypothetical protein
MNKPVWEDLSRYPESIRGDSSVDAQLRRQFDESRQRMQRFRRLHLRPLIALLIGAIILVLVRGISVPGLMLVAGIATVTAFRWWSFNRSASAG